MLIANYAIGSTGGHADSDPAPEDRIRAADVREGVCNGADQCRAAVRYQVKYGADVIKFMPSGGVLSLADPVDNVQLTQEEMDAIVSEAHAWGRKVAAHCHGDRAARMAIAAGVDSIEHGSFLEDDTLRLMKQKHVYLVPTLSTGHWIAPRVDTMPPAVAAKARAAMAHQYTTYAHAVKFGVPVALGTDAGVGPHGSNAIEFSLMAEYGSTPEQSLLSGTSLAADLLGLADRTGSLQAGRDADVVAVPGNVLRDLHATEHPLLVMKQGHIVVGPPAR